MKKPIHLLGSRTDKKNIDMDYIRFICQDFILSLISNCV